MNESTLVPLIQLLNITIMHMTRKAQPGRRLPAWALRLAASAYGFFVPLLVILILLVLGQGGAAANSGSDQPQQVLILHSYAPDFVWTRELHTGILSALEKQGQTTSYRVEYLDAKHQDSPAYLEQLFRLYQEKYLRTPDAHIDGILLTDNHALDFVARYRDAFFPHVPMVACGINSAQSVPANVFDVNIILERVAHTETLKAALRQNPETHTIYVVIDNTLTGQSIRQDFLAQTAQLGRQIRLEVLPPMTGEALLQFADNRVPGELIYLLVYFQDAAGKLFTADAMPRAIAARSPVPVYAGWDFQLNTGVVGGCVTSAYGQGQKAAQTLLDRLAGNNPPHMYDGLTGVNRHTYDYSALERFVIPLQSLPADAVVLNRPRSYFERHRSAILGALGIIAILGVIILLLLQNIRRQRTINRGNAEILTLNREVIETQLDLLTTLGEVIESRSHDTANHVRRVAAYSVLLGKKYGLSEEDLLLLEAASPMHDIGKIGIPDAILHKPDRLTAEEYEIIKHHTVIGEHILRVSDRKLIASARIIALQHHECWDGSGYPCGLKGEEISIMARISSLADVYDALSLSRVYKPPWPQEKVLQFIREQRGAMFDPRIVDLFFEHLDEVEAIKNRLSDPVASIQNAVSLQGPVQCPIRSV
nr:HD domain-containing phosphohydrolase [uncultured Desulfobulbus sp.]